MVSNVYKAISTTLEANNLISEGGRDQGFTKGADFGMYISGKGGILAAGTVKQRSVRGNATGAGLVQSEVWLRV